MLATKGPIYFYLDGTQVPNGKKIVKIKRKNYHVDDNGNHIQVFTPNQLPTHQLRTKQGERVPPTALLWERNETKFCVMPDGTEKEVITVEQRSKSQLKFKNGEGVPDDTEIIEEGDKKFVLLNDGIKEEVFTSYWLNPKFKDGTPVPDNLPLSTEGKKRSVTTADGSEVPVFTAHALNQANQRKQNKLKITEKPVKPQGISGLKYSDGTLVPGDIAIIKEKKHFFALHGDEKVRVYTSVQISGSRLKFQNGDLVPENLPHIKEGKKRYVLMPTGERVQVFRSNTLSNQRYAKGITKKQKKSKSSLAVISTHSNHESEGNLATLTSGQELNRLTDSSYESSDISFMETLDAPFPFLDFTELEGLTDFLSEDPHKIPPVSANTQPSSGLRYANGRAVPVEAEIKTEGKKFYVLNGDTKEQIYTASQLPGNRLKFKNGDPVPDNLPYFKKGQNWYVTMANNEVIQVFKANALYQRKRTATKRSTLACNGEQLPIEPMVSEPLEQRSGVNEHPELLEETTNSISVGHSPGGLVNNASSRYAFFAPFTNSVTTNPNPVEASIEVNSVQNSFDKSVSVDPILSYFNELPPAIGGLAPEDIEDFLLEDTSSHPSKKSKL
nr:hypothetical protein [Legionella jordanis]